MDLRRSPRGQDRRRQHRSRARRRWMSMSTATARPMRGCRSDQRCGEPRCAIASISSSSTTSPTRSILPSSARRSTPMPARPCFPNCRATRLEGRTAKILGAYHARKRPGPAAGDAGGGRNRAEAMSDARCHSEAGRRLQGLFRHCCGQARELRGAQGRGQCAGRRKRRRQIDADEDHCRR